MTIKVKNVKGTIDFSTGVAGLTPTFTAGSSGSPLLDSAYTGNHAGDIFWDSAKSQLKMFVNDSAGWFNITTTDSAETLSSIPPTPEFRWIGHKGVSSTNGNYGTFTFSQMTSATDGDFTVQEDDTIILVFGRGNSYGYYPSYTPTDGYGNFTYVSGASYSGNDTYDHDHAIFYRTVTSGDIANGYVRFQPQSLGTMSYQACAFLFYVFRGVTGIDNGKGSQYNNRSLYSYTNQHGTILDDAGQYIVFSHANGWNDYRGGTSVSSAYYEADPGWAYWRVNDTDDINISAWLYKSTAAVTWYSPAFSQPSYTSASDATLVSCRVY
jgi:hypothetical protein